jgi:hypothetical protein
MKMNTKLTATTLCVVSFMFDGDTINLAALLELRAAGWSVEIEHSGAIPGWGSIEPQVWFNARKEFPDNSPGEGPGDELMDEVRKEIEAFSEAGMASSITWTTSKIRKPRIGRITPGKIRATTVTFGRTTTEHRGTPILR